MRRLIIAATTIAVLAVPAISMASAHVPHYYTLTRGENHSFIGIASAASGTPVETLSGVLHHSTGSPLPSRTP